MKIVIAPDSYKESLSAAEVALAIEAGFREVFPGARFCRLPVADGGEGTVDAMVAALDGRRVPVRVTGPLGEPVEAFYGLCGDGATAVIEMAAASGLALVPPAQRNPLLTTSFGTGELIRAALDEGARHLIIGIGGSATNDAGAGMLQALGAALLDGAGRALARGGGALGDLARIAVDGLDPRLAACRIEVACDVDNPLTGARGASAVFGPQKGATPALVTQLDSALAHFAVHARQATGRDVAEIAGAGAAGGLGAGLMFFTSARLRPGVGIVLDAVGFAEIVKTADFVITGEGRTDFQTAFGKAPVGVAKVAKQFGVPVFCLSGGLGDGADDVLAQGIDAVMSICDRPMTLEACMQAGGALIEAGSARLCRVVRAARKDF